MNDVELAVRRERHAASETDLAAQWLGDFERALQAGDKAALAALFLPDSHWRDLLAFTWHITPKRGAEEIAAALVAAQKATGAHGFRLAPGRTPPHPRKRLGNDVIEALFTFETKIGRGDGVLRLMPEGEGSAPRAWTFLTTLEELKGFEEHIGDRRPAGDAYSRNFGGENWLDRRIRQEAYEDREPTVLVVGGGQAGLGIAARLNQLDVDTLVVDKLPRIGDCWRLRYHSLALHNHIRVNHLPYMPFPPTWPKYIPKDMLANWFEYYAGAMEINFWTGTAFVRGSYDEAAKQWTAVVKRPDGSERTLRPRHIVFANGVSGIPYVPKLPGLDDFAGTVVHSEGFDDGSAWKGKNAKGFQFDIGEDETGHQMKYRRRGGGYYLDAGCAQLIIDGEVGLLQYDRIDRFVKDGALLKDGTVFPADLIVLATGYYMQQELVRRVLGEDISEKVGPIWGIGEDGETANMWKRTAQDGLWFIAGSLPQCRIYSKYLALQIKAQEEGMLGGL